MSNKKSSVVRGICLAYIGGKSMQQIAKALNAEHVPCFGGGIRWTQGQVAPQLRCESVRTVLTDEQFASLQVKLSQNKGRKGGTKSRWHSNLFPNRVKCAVCSHSVTTHNTQTAEGKKLRYYVCHGKCKRLHRYSARIEAVELDFFMLFVPELAKLQKPLSSVADIQKTLAVNDLNKVEQLEQALRNPEVRAKLVKLLPNLVTCLTIDFGNKSYTITTTDGATTPIRLLPKLYPAWHDLWYCSESKGHSVYIADRWFFLNNQWNLRTRD